MKFFRNLAGILLTTAANAPISLLISVLLARWLSLEDRGLYAVCIAFATTLSILFQFGWPSAVIYRLRSVGSPPAVVAGAGLAVVAMLSLAAIAASLALEPLITTRFLDDAPSRVFHLALATVPFRLLGNVFGSVARGIDRFRYENWYSFAMNAATLVALGGLLLIGDGALVGVLWAVALVHVAATLGLLLTVMRETGLTMKLGSAEFRAEIAASLGFGFKVYLSTMASRLHERQDIFVLAYLAVEPEAIAYFAVAKGAMHLLDLVPVALNTAAYPQIAGLPSGEAADFTCSMVRQCVLFVLPGSIVLAAVAEFLLPAVYGREYAASVIPFLLLLPCVLFGAVDGVVGRFFNATNRQTAIVATRSVSALTNLALNFSWVPLHGIEGAAAAACTSFALQAVLAIWIFRARTGAKLRDLVVLRRADVAPYVNQLARFRRRSAR